ncbi:dihydropteroate synthase, partial [Leuconostoc lactis]|uniref:dihydropteroate synthase n=1 Tax=Leuconostoc lactis TaxID=1246 RepID=UPI0028A2272A
MYFEQITTENPVLAQMVVRGEGAAWRITAANQQCLAEYSAIPLTDDTYWLSRGAIVALHERTASPELQQWLVAIDHLWVVNGKTLHDADGIIYGVLNVSPESFYNGDQVADVDTMVARAGEMLAKGADVIEVGGQTTKPGFEAAGLELTPTAEIDRIAPVITGIKAQYPDAVIAVDTYKYDVMVRAVALGVDIINDV